MTRRGRALACAAVLAVLVGSMAGRPAESAPKWAAASRATIHPGVQTVTAGGQCTSNFVFYDSKYAYIGQAAHCSMKADFLEDVNPCTVPMQKIGTRVRVQGASQYGTLVYNSWNTMQSIGERSPNACSGNDFALVRLHPADRGRVNPSVPFWGGPTGIDKSAEIGDKAYTYGNSGLRQGIEALSPKFGVSTGDWNNGWTHGIYTVTPGVFGDSGSAVLSPSGRAFGVLVTIQYVLPGENGVTDLYLALLYMKRYTALDAVTLAKGTVPFSGIP